MQIENHKHSELFYNHLNIDELNLENKNIVNLIKHHSGYTYCKLCGKPYLTYNLKYHDNKKHQLYEYYKDSSSKSSGFKTTPHG